MTEQIETLDTQEMIITKAEQLNALALVAQGGNIESLGPEKIENLFSLVIDISNEISAIAKCSLN